jgi:hypothetical protein
VKSYIFLFVLPDTYSRLLGLFNKLLVVIKSIIGKLIKLKNVCYYSFDLSLANPPKPHSFCNLPLQSADPNIVNDALQAVSTFQIECLHPFRDAVLATASEITRGGIPLCDFNPTLGPNGRLIGHPAANSLTRGYYKCRDCNLIMCANCYSYIFVICLPNRCSQLLGLWLR